MSGNSASSLSYMDPESSGCTARLREFAYDATPCTCKVVMESRNWCARRSTKSPKCRKKSAPIIGCDTSAITKIHGKIWRKPIWRVNECWPNVQIGVPFAARNTNDDKFFRSVREGGITLIAAPVSIRNRAPVTVSVTWNRRPACA